MLAPLRVRLWRAASQLARLFFATQLLPQVGGDFSQSRHSLLLTSLPRVCISADPEIRHNTSNWWYPDARRSFWKDAFAVVQQERSRHLSSIHDPSTLCVAGCG